MFVACQKAFISASCLCSELNIAADTLLDITDQGKKKKRTTAAELFQKQQPMKFSKDRWGGQEGFTFSSRKNSLLTDL